MLEWELLGEEVSGKLTEVWLSLEAGWNPFTSLTAAVGFDFSDQTGDRGRGEEVGVQSWVKEVNGLRKCMVSVL